MKTRSLPLSGARTLVCDGALPVGIGEAGPDASCATSEVVHAFTPIAFNIAVRLWNIELSRLYKCRQTGRYRWVETKCRTKDHCVPIL
jgi:hypothetical protein